MLMERCVLFERCELAPSHERDRCLEQWEWKINAQFHDFISFIQGMRFWAFHPVTPHTGDNFYCSKPLSERIKMAKVEGPRHED